MFNALNATIVAPLALTALVAGLAAYRYGPRALHRLSPAQWRLIRRALDRLRQSVWSVPKPAQPDLVVDAPLADVRVALGKASFTNAWEMSYAYEGEDLNMRRPVYVADHGRPWQQDHVRGWDQGDGTTALDVHRELEPTEYPAAHLDDQHMRTEPARGAVIGVLEAAGYDVRVSEK